MWQIGAFNSGAMAGQPMALHDIEFLKKVQVSGGEFDLPVDASDIKKRFAKVKLDFIGKPLFAFEFAKLIVLIRRRVSLETNVSLFFRLAEAEVDFLVTNLSTRWLLGVADTYADHGTPLQQATAAMIVSLFNMVKLSETERLLLVDSQHDPAKVEAVGARREGAAKLWDGMRAYSIYSGDMPSNMIARMRKTAGKDKVLSKILDKLLERALAGATILMRLSSYNPRFMPEEWLMRD